MSDAPAALPLLTDDQKADFDRDGFLVLRGVLTPDEVARYIGVVDALEADEREAKNLDAQATIEIRNAVARPGGDAFLPLLDHPLALALATYALGWNIQLTTSHVFVRTPTPEKNAAFKAIDWHADGPNPPFPQVNGVSPRLYAKIGYFLTDLSVPNKGNLRVVPGSHRQAARPAIDPATDDPVGAIQVLTRPGDAVFFEQRTWHAVGPNYADASRKNVYIGYCPRWLRAIDFDTQPSDLLARANPIQRQLLGAATTEPLARYLPGRYDFADVPLKALTEA